MPRPKTGTVRYVDRTRDKPGHYKARISCIDGSRPWIHLPASPCSPEAEALARQTAAEYSERFEREGIVAGRPVRSSAATAGTFEPVPNAPRGREPFSAYSERWFEDRKRRGLSSIDTDRGRIRNHVWPLLSARPICEVTQDELREVVESLDSKVLDGAFSWRTAQKVWGLVTKLFSDACQSKTAALRVRADNPASGVRGPDAGVVKAKQWLFPAESMLLLGCNGVPLRWRRLYALSIYLYTRPGELAVLRWDDVDLDQEYVSIHQALDLKTGAVKPTKTGVTRRMPIHASLRPLIHQLREAARGEGLVVQHDHPNKDARHGFPPLEDLSANLRDHLRRAGATRADLFEDSATTKNVTFYDLRATGITWEALAGTEPLRIQQRAGHERFETTQGYIRQAEAVGLASDAPFPALPSCLVSSQSSRIVHRDDSVLSTTRNYSTKTASPTGFEPVLQP
jgi:integrase